MKKFLILFVCLFYIIQTNANTYWHYNHAYVSKVAFSFEGGDIYVECNKDGKYWLRYRNGFGLSSIYYDSGINKKDVRTGKHLYLKLSNADILILECKEVTSIFYDYEVFTEIWKKYKNYCYFDLSDEQIEKLKKYEIVKMRVELEDEVADIELIKSIKLSDTIEKLEDQLNRKLEEERRKKESLSNPLKDF